MSCPFCSIKRRTEWYLSDVCQLVVACEDLRARNYSYRILVVGTGPYWHHLWEEYPRHEQLFLVGVAKFIADYHIKIGKAKELVKIDFVHSKEHRDHGHIQACMR